MEKEKQEMLTNMSKGIGVGGAVSMESQQYDAMKSESEAMEKKMKKVSKTLKEMKEKYETKLTKLEQDMQRKAEKDSLIENQQKFFDNLH